MQVQNLGNHTNDYANQNSASDNLFLGIIYFASFFISNFNVRVTNRDQTIANQHHVNDGDDSNRQTKQSIVKETNFNTSICQSGVGSDVRRGTYQSTHTAGRSHDSQRHQNLGTVPALAVSNTQANGHQYSNSTGVGQESRHCAGHNHNGNQQFALRTAGNLNGGKTNFLRQTSLEHSATNNEHTTEQDYVGIHQAGVSFFHSHNTGDGEVRGQNHSCKSDRNCFSNEEESYHH